MLLLHLSDIHFREGEVGTAMDPNANLRNELLRDAEDMCGCIGTAPEAVLVSGDLAFAAHPDEYGYALGWLDRLCQGCGTSLASVFVIPGNHDVARSIAGRPLVQSLHRDIKNASDIAREPLMAGLLKDAEAGRLLYEALQPYNVFAGQFFCDLLPPERTIASRDLILNDGSILRLSGLNSAFVSSAADKAGDLFVDPASFQLLRERGVEHLVMCHHPYSWLREGDRLKDFLNDVARLHLFGHEHTNRIELARDWVRIGASAAHPDRTEPGWEPGYNLIEISVDGVGAHRNLTVQAHVRIWQQRPGQFRAKMYRQDDVFLQTIPLDAWSAPAAAPAQAEPVAAEVPAAAPTETPARSDPMDSLREISIRFFKLTLSQKSAIAGKLKLFEEEDSNQPDFERFRRVFLRARDRGLVADLDREVKAATGQ
jgi:GTPase-associated adaptor domain/Calcineurin-like phosphoesterase